jgi:pullulanase
MPGVAAFSDDMRDALRGPFNDDHKGAFLAGNAGEEESLKFGIVGGIMHPEVDMQKVNYDKKPWALQPTQQISYVSCHDDMCLVDRLKTSVFNIDTDQIIRLDELAQTAVFLSQGVRLCLVAKKCCETRKVCTILSIHPIV